MFKDLLTLATAKAKTAGLVIGALAIGSTMASVGTSSFVPVDNSTAVVETVAPEPETGVTPVEGSGTAESGTSEEDGDSTTAPSPTDTTATVTPAPCPTDVKNHGEYVSSVAKDKSLSGREHGKAVSAAAHSDCGKKSGEAEAEESTESEESDTEDADDTDDADDADDDSDDDEATEKKAKKAKKAKKSKSRNS